MIQHIGDVLQARVVGAGVVIPPVGKILDVTAKSMIISSPNQNSGIEYRTSVTPSMLCRTRFLVAIPA